MFNLSDTINVCTKNDNGHKLIKINIQDLHNTINNSQYCLREHCLGCEHFKFYIEFEAPVEKYIETCMSFIDFFSSATEIQDKPIFIVDKIADRCYVCAVYPYPVNAENCSNLRIRITRLDKNKIYKIIDKRRLCKPLPTIKKEKCWLLDANGKEYKGNDILGINPREYLCQIVDRKLYPLPILSTSSSSFQGQVNTSLDIIGLVIQECVKQKEETPKETPVISKPILTLPPLKLSEDLIEAQTEWFGKQCKIDLRESFETLKRLYEKLSSSSQNREDPRRII